MPPTMTRTTLAPHAVALHERTYEVNATEHALAQLWPCLANGGHQRVVYTRKIHQERGSVSIDVAPLVTLVRSEMARANTITVFVYHDDGICTAETCRDGEVLHAVRAKARGPVRLQARQMVRRAIAATLLYLEETTKE